MASSPEDSFGADVTLVHEWLTNVAGSEKVVDGLRHAFPGSAVSTSVWWPPAFPGWDVRPSALQRFVRGPNAHVRLLPLLPAAFASLRLPPAATVITSFHTFALYARVPASAHHIAYCHTPPRFLWLSDQLTTERLPLPGPLASAAAAVLRPVDVRRARRPDLFLANSAVTARRVEAAYGRGADVVHPPVDVERFAAARRDAPDDYHLVLSRLVPYKRIELAIAACTELGWRLVVAGTGRAEAALRQMAGPTIEFVGHVGDDDLPALVAGARALVFPGVEDFGIVPVEAMAAGTPVVAFAAGGATETVVEGRSGTFFHDASTASLVDALRRAAATDWDRGEVSRSVAHLGQERFAREIRDVVASLADGR